MSDNRTNGRNNLRAWQELQPDNFFTSNRHLQRILKRIWDAPTYADHAKHLTHFGAVVAGSLDQAAIVNNERQNLPRLDRWSPIGERIESIAHHPSYDTCGQAIYQDGRVISVYESPASNVLAQTLFYLSSHAGEAGHNCPVACTAGVVKALQHAGASELKERWLDGLLETDYSKRLDGAQFLTEVQGGSDVGANCVRAEPDGEGMGTSRWRIYGEKWFCSNADADLILMTARTENGPDGTAGLGLFLVPRYLEDGSVNAFAIRRLKEKLGTRSMASAEIDFQGATGYAVGDVNRGFATVMECVINTSRLYNSVGCAGIARRASVVAAAYAETRQAFGQPIMRFPLVQEMMASLKSVEAMMLSGVLWLAKCVDRKEQFKITDDEAAFIRVATNISKMRTCQHSHRAVLTAIETLGGNGAIETFSVLPRLLRDNVVYENWEGTHNTLIAQSMRDFKKYQLHHGFFRHLRACVEAVPVDRMPNIWAKLKKDILISISAVEEAIHRIVTMEEADVAILQMRDTLERAADVYFAASFFVDACDSNEDEVQQDLDSDLLTFFLEEHVRALEQSKDKDFALTVSRIAKSQLMGCHEPG
jgi:acyl-CoA dehydrogenase